MANQYVALPQAQNQNFLNNNANGASLNGDQEALILNSLNFASNRGAGDMYVIGLTQASTSAPTIANSYLNTLGVTLGNNTAVTPTIARTGAGVYTLTLSGATWGASKVAASIAPYLDSANAPTYIQVTRTSATVLTITAKGATGTAKDALCTNLFVSIYCY